MSCEKQAFARKSALHSPNAARDGKASVTSGFLAPPVSPGSDADLWTASPSGFSSQMSRLRCHDFVSRHQCTVCPRVWQVVGPWTWCLSSSDFVSRRARRCNATFWRGFFGSACRIESCRLVESEIWHEPPFGAYTKSSWNRSPGPWQPLQGLAWIPWLQETLAWTLSPRLPRHLHSRTACNVFTSISIRG